MTKRLCSICARGGSKGIVNKNTRPLIGIPLIAHTILQAKQSKMFNVIAVSSDDNDILEISKKYGADILIKRPDSLASDTSAKLPAIQHCALETESITGMKYDTYVDLDATSPLRNIDDIREAIYLFERHPDATNLITGMKSRRNPYFNLVEINESGYVQLSKSLNVSVIRRQDAPVCFDMNASIYIWNRDSLLNSTTIFQEKTILFEMPEERSIDIDSEIDFEIVEMLAKKRGRLL